MWIIPVLSKSSYLFGRRNEIEKDGRSIWLVLGLLQLCMNCWLANINLKPSFPSENEKHKLDHL